MKSNHILVTTTSFPSMGKRQQGKCGGAPFVLFDCLIFQQAGFKVDVLAPKIECAPDDELCENIRIIRFKYPLMKYNPNYYSKPIYSRGNIMAKVAIILMAIWFTFNIFVTVSKNKYTLIWANWLQVGVLSKVAALGRVKVIFTMRGSDVRNSSQSSVFLMSRIIPDFFNMFLIDKEIDSWVKKFGLKEISVPIAYKHKQLQREVVEKNVTVIGRLDGFDFDMRVKGLGLNTFLGIKDLMASRDDFILTVVGSGMMLGQYQALFDHFQHRVRFVGWQEDLSAFLEQAYLVIGGASINAVITDTVPYGIPPMISAAVDSDFWKNGDNCLTYDPISVKSIMSTLDYALDNPDELQQIGLNAQTAIAQYALPQEQAAAIWRENIIKFLGPS